jgi:hypothetical protein
MILSGIEARQIGPIRTVAISAAIRPLKTIRRICKNIVEILFSVNSVEKERNPGMTTSRHLFRLLDQSYLQISRRYLGR